MTKAQGWVLILGILLIVGIGAAVIVSAIRAPADTISNLPRQVSTKIGQILHPTPTIYPDPVTVVNEIRTLARLETVQYTVEKVITAESGQGPLGFLFGDKLLLVAHGVVIAGIDLGKLQASDVRIDAQGSIFIIIPSAEVFTYSLDESKTYVYHRDTGPLAPSKKDLETSARKAAEQQILQAALEDGILQTATTNGKAYLQRFLLSIGLKQVTFIDATPVPAGSTVVPQPTVTATATP
jgi:hypothetical protein